MPGERRLRYEYLGGTIDASGRLVYSQDGSKHLLACQRVLDPDIQVGLLGFRRMQPKRFIPAHKDRQPIRLALGQTGQEVQLAYPGKSAFLYFDGVPTTETLGRWVNESLKRIKEDKDHLHLSTVAWIEEAGWQVWWTPLPERDQWLHVRLVPNSIVEKGIDPTLDQAAALRDVFIKAI